MTANFRIERRAWLMPEMEAQLTGMTVEGRVQIFDVANGDTVGLTGLLLRTKDGRLVSVHYDRPSKVLVVLAADDPSIQGAAG